MPSHKVRMLYVDGMKLAEEFIQELREVGYTRIEIAGSLRRKEQYVGDVDLVVETDDLDKVLTIPGVERIQGKVLLGIVWKGQQFNVLKAAKEEWGSSLFYLTGPERYAIAYRMKSKVKGWVLNQKGLFDGTGKKLAGETEESIYKMFDKNYKAPEKRGK